MFAATVRTASVAQPRLAGVINARRVQVDRDHQTSVLLPGMVWILFGCRPYKARSVFCADVKGSATAAATLQPLLKCLKKQTTNFLAVF